METSTRGNKGRQERCWCSGKLWQLHIVILSIWPSFSQGRHIVLKEVVVMGYKWKIRLQ